MSLSKYKAKRHFDKTPEPTGGKPDSEVHRFVVQKHHASHLHYDFRLEMEGVLKSWAVPKGPSLNPADKRLAMMVEDHPWDYRLFEGIIPEGYGAGTVIVWDEGTYEPIEKAKTKNENDKNLLHQLYQGSLSFVLKGKKLKGTFSLVKTHGRGENSWLLMKQADKYASKTDITEKDTSVLSNRNLEEVKQNSDAIWKSNRASKASVLKPVSEIPEVAKTKGVKRKMPTDIKPMLCMLTKNFNFSEDYIYEVKWDGYRVIATVNKDKVNLTSRNGINYNKKYQLISEACKLLGRDLILDGEVVLMDKEGKPDFNGLLQYSGAENIVYYVFDILWLDGFDLTGLEIEERRQILAEVVNSSEIIQFSESFDDGKALFELMKEKGMEGIVAKKRSSTYQADKRNNNWLKIPVEKKQEFVIGGWSESDSGTPFRSLLFGYYENKKFLYLGHAGGGFKEKEKAGILLQLKKLEVKKKPFTNEVESSTPVHWVKPVLVANIKFADYTGSGKIRKPAIFQGFREDKDPKDVTKEQEVVLDQVDDSEITATIKDPDAEDATGGQEPSDSSKKLNSKKETKTNTEDVENASNWKYILNEKISSKETFQIGSHEIVLTNVEKLIWPEVPKASLIRYYHAVAPFILPHLKDRPQSLHIKNNGAVKPGFYIKDMEGHQPSFSTIFETGRKHKKKGKADQIHYLVCNEEPTLLFMVNLGCIDINPWTSKTSNPDFPDYIIIDLDPSDYDFKKVIQTSLAAKKVFDKYKLVAFPKTSGKTGMHLYIPCSGFTFSECRIIATVICQDICDLVPDISTTELTVSKRGNKLYIDPNQNDEADTVAAPYSVRPAATPMVSTPLEWKEINLRLKASEFTIDTILERIEKKGDLFKEVLNKKYHSKNNAGLKKILDQ